MFVLIPGPLVGMLLMLLVKAGVDFANTLSAILFAVTVTISVIGLAQAYLRYQALTVTARTSEVMDPESITGIAPA